MRSKFDKAVSYIKREGIQSLLSWLENETDYFSAPASTIFHGNYEGGLLEHSLNVLEFALNSWKYLTSKNPDYEYLRESIIICALFHDVAKTNVYHKEEKWTKNDHNQWVKYMGWVYKENFPYGHGEKSVYLINKYMQLTEGEALGIRFHHGAYEIGATIASNLKYSYDEAFKHPLVKLMISSDILATSLERTIDYKEQAINR